MGYLEIETVLWTGVLKSNFEFECAEGEGFWFEPGVMSKSNIFAFYMI